MLPKVVSTRHLRVAAVLLFTVSCAAPFAVAKLRDTARTPQTRQLPAGQPLRLARRADQTWIAISKAQVGASREVINLLLQAAELPALEQDAPLDVEARAYCNALSQLEKRPPCYAEDLDHLLGGCSGYRLPLQTELALQRLQPTQGMFHRFPTWPGVGKAATMEATADLHRAESYHVVREADEDEVAWLAETNNSAAQ